EADERYRRNLNEMIKAPTDKIWGGKRVPPGTFPDVVALRGGGALCSGTLVTPDAVLTAAHCHCGGVNTEAVFGESLDNPKEVIPIDRSQSYIACDQPLKNGDLALMFLRRPSTATPRRLAKSEWIDGAMNI